MTAIRFQNFSGLIPRSSKRLLPDMAAITARNTKLLNGELRGYNAPRLVADFTNEYFTVKRAYRIPQFGAYDDLWLTFDSRDVDIVRSPVVNDTFDRYYWAGDGRPQYNTLARIRDDLAPYFLGVPAPDTTITVTPPGAGDLTRAYVTTFVSAYGEEGAPSDPVIDTGAAGTWVIGNLDTSPQDAANRNITHIRIYRTVPGNNSSTFFFVVELALGTTSYNDNNSDETVASNNVLESTSWAMPPSDLEGFVAMPNGYLVGWKDRRLCFSEQYRPHAWPAEFELATEFEIIGLAVWGNILVIGTRSNPYLGQGNVPASFTMQKLDAIEPCLSRRGMVTTTAGVYYPSISGLVMVNSQGVVNITQDLVTKEEWAQYNPEEIYAASLGLQYIAFNSPSFGFVFNPTEQNARLIELDRFTDVVGIETDRYTGEVYLIQSDRAFQWDPLTSERLYWRWKSKEYHFPKPLNFGALKVKFEVDPVDVTSDVLSYYKPYNDARFAAGPLNTIGGHVINGVQGAGQVPSWTEPENRMPLGGSPLYPINFMLLQIVGVRIIAYADGEKVFDTIATGQDMLRMPAGFKRDVWQFEFIGNTTCYSISVAETGRELNQV